MLYKKENSRITSAGQGRVPKPSCLISCFGWHHRDFLPPIPLGPRHHVRGCPPWRADGGYFLSHSGTTDVSRVAYTWPVHPLPPPPTRVLPALLLSWQGRAGPGYP